MYKSIAAYAAAMVAQPGKYMPATQGEDNIPVWGITAQGEQTYTNLERAHKVSILGAIRAGHDALGGGQRAYNTLDKAIRHTITMIYPSKTILTLDRDEAAHVLIVVARG